MVRARAMEKGDAVATPTFAHVVAIVLAVVAIVSSPVPDLDGGVSRVFSLLGGVLCAVGAGGFYRRCYAVEPPDEEEGPFATLLARLVEKDAGKGAAPRFASLLGGGALGILVRKCSSFGLSSAGFFGLGVFARGFVALALCVGMMIVHTSRHYRSTNESMPFATVAVGILFVCESYRTLPMATLAYVGRFRWSRVRFEIGGLGTRVEDMTPAEHRDLSGSEVLALLVIGLTLSWIGGGMQGVMLLASGLAMLGGVASTVACVGSPLLIVVLAPLASSTPALVPLFLPILVFAALADVQRVAVLVKASPALVDRVFVVTACAVAIVCGLLRSPMRASSPIFSAESIESHDGFILILAGFGVIAALVYVLRAANEAAAKAEESPIPPSALHPGPALSGELFPARRSLFGPIEPNVFTLCPLAPMALGFVTPPAICLYFALGALVGRFARGRPSETVTPEPLASFAAGTIVVTLFLFAVWGMS